MQRRRGKKILLCFFCAALFMKGKQNGTAEKIDFDKGRYTVRTEKPDSQIRD